jgi:hypothetical protein
VEEIPHIVVDGVVETTNYEIIEQRKCDNCEHLVSNRTVDWKKGSYSRVRMPGYEPLAKDFKASHER